jgi:hypothetical protein
MQDQHTEMQVINDYDDLMEFIQLQRECVEQGNTTFLYDGQYYSVTVAESIINGHLLGRDAPQCGPGCTCDGCLLDRGREEVASES